MTEPDTSSAPADTITGRGSGTSPAPGRGRPGPGAHRPRRRRRSHIAVLLAPAFTLYSVFMIYPLADSIRRSLFDDDGGWVGLANVERLLTDPNWSGPFRDALIHNVWFFVIHLLVQNPIALALAALLTVQGIRGQAIYRTIIFIPTTLSVVIVGFIWQLILSPLWGIVTTPYLGQPDTVLPTLSLISVWQWVGIPMIFFYAVLISIPDDLIEAARVDGANGWHTFWRVTFPLILPMLGIVSIVTYVGNFNAFDLIFTVKGALAGPDYASDILGTFFYRAFFGNQLRPGSAAMGATVATAMFLVILFGVLVYTFGYQRRVTTYEL